MNDDALAMAQVMDKLAGARRANDPGVLTDWIPYARFMGIRAELADDQRIIGVMRYSDHLIGNRTLPALHGGVLGALLESTAIFQLLWTADSVILPKIINITIDYLRSARPVDTFARADITRLGRRVANVQARAWQDDPEQPISVAHGNFLIVPAPSAP